MVGGLTTLAGMAIAMIPAAILSISILCRISVIIQFKIPGTEKKNIPTKSFCVPIAGTLSVIASSVKLPINFEYFIVKGKMFVFFMGYLIFQHKLYMHNARR